MLFIKLNNDLENSAMSIALKILRMEKIRHLNDGLWIDNDTTEYSALGLNILRQQFFHVSGSPSIYKITSRFAQTGTIKTL